MHLWEHESGAGAFTVDNKILGVCYIASLIAIIRLKIKYMQIYELPATNCKDFRFTDFSWIFYMLMYYPARRISISKRVTYLLLFTRVLVKVFIQWVSKK